MLLVVLLLCCSWCCYIRIVSKDVCATPNMRQGLRITQLHRTYQVFFCYHCYRKEEPLIRWCCGFHQTEGMCDLGDVSDMYEMFPVFRTGETTPLCVTARNECYVPTRKSSYLCVTVTGNVHPWLLQCNAVAAIYKYTLLLCLHRDMMLRTWRFLFLVTATCMNGVTVCACHPEDIVKAERFHPTLPPNFKSTRAAHQAVVQQQQQRYNIFIEPHVASCSWDRLCSPFATRDTPGISSLRHPEGEPCITM